MASDTNEWVSRALRDGDPRCLENWEELLARIDLVGFLPLFANTVPGFSVEEMTAGSHWWTGDGRDPWEWRMIISRSRAAAYGKFFAGRAGFISLDWLPAFANWRRDGYDFDSLWDEGKAQLRAKKIMDLFENGDRLFSFEVKRRAGFGPGGEKNFEGTLTSLMDGTYLTVCDFRQRTNKRGEQYGWSIAMYGRPEDTWGGSAVRSLYGEDPEASRKRIYDRVSALYGVTDPAALRRIRG